MTTTNQKLIQLMSKHALTSSDVAELVYVSRDTVHSWRVSNKATRFRVMPEGLLELLEIKIKQRES